MPSGGRRQAVWGGQDPSGPAGPWVWSPRFASRDLGFLTWNDVVGEGGFQALTGALGSVPWHGFGGYGRHPGRLPVQIAEYVGGRRRIVAQVGSGTPRPSKTDLAARLMFVRTHDAIEAHLTLVLTALAVGRETQNRTGLAIRNVIRQRRPLRSATIAVNGAVQAFPQPSTPNAWFIDTGKRDLYDVAGD